MTAALVSATLGDRASRPAGAVLLVAHGSRDRRAAAATRSLGRAVAAERPGLAVRTAYLDHTAPRPDQALAALAGAGHARATVVPLLLTDAHHARVDLPAVLAAARDHPVMTAVRQTDVLGPVDGAVPAPLVAGLCRRLEEAVSGTAAGPLEAVVLAAAGTRDEAARATVAQAASAVSAALHVPVRAAYASAASPTVGAATAGLRAAGARRVAVAAYFLAPGRLYRTAVDSARAAGAVAVAEPLGTAPELVSLILTRLSRRSWSCGG